MRKQIHDNPIDHGRACSLSHGTWRRVGAKLACAGACALMAGQLLLPSVALAAEWVSVGGTQYNRGTAAGDDAGTWSWDGADDMKLNGYDGGSIGARGNLTIGVTGTNTVTPTPGRAPSRSRTAISPSRGRGPSTRRLRIMCLLRRAMVSRMETSL